MNKILSQFRILDYLLFSVMITIVIWLGIFVYAKNVRPNRLIIETPSGQWIYQLDADKTVDIPGVLGTTRVRIEKGSVMIISSPCPNKTCMTPVPLSKAGDWNACLPNRVFLHIEGEAGSDTAVTQ